MKRFTGYVPPAPPIIEVCTTPRRRRVWLWVLSIIVIVVLVFVSQIPVRTYYYRDWLEARYYETPLIVWVLENCYFIDPYGK